MRVSPCKNCTLELRNNLKHHSICPEYLEWRAELDAINNKRNENNEIKGYEREKRRKIDKLLRDHRVSDRRKVR